jgi:histidinol-phosphate aminotransferase
MDFFSLLPDNIRTLKPYVPGKPIEEVERELGITAVKMASNENPLGPSPLAIEAVNRFLRKSHRYPIGDGYYLRQKLANTLDVSMDEIILGSGSTELIELAARTFLTSADEVVIAEQSFVMYTLAAEEMNARIVYAPLKNYTYDLQAILQAVTPRTKIIYLANPNNPTGTMFSSTQLDDLLARLPSSIVVVLDEAYFEYVQDPGYSHSLDYVRERRHVLVLRTFSKVYGLAGMRVGYGLAHPDLIRCLNQVRSPFNTNSIAQVAAQAALDDQTHVRFSIKSNRIGYEFLTGQLAFLGVKFVPSVTNFILVDTGRDCMRDFQLLMQKGVIVRPMKGNGFPTALRLTIGTSDENKKFIEALKEIS